MESWYTPTEATEPPTVARVLVFAPHPDDEIFGPGGTLVRFLQAGAQVQVCILTDGAAYAEDDERSRVFEIRKAESQLALDTLGTAPPRFLGLQDRSLASHAGLPGLMAEEMAHFQPDIVLAPSLWEIHPDHLACARAVATAAALVWQQQSRLPSLWFYEIGNPLRANVLIDITDVWALKQKAMACFGSQHLVQDYARHIESLNTYRTYNLPWKVRYAEAFHRLGPEQFEQLVRTGQDLAGPFAGLQVQALLAAAEAHAETLQSQWITERRDLAVAQQEVVLLKSQLQDTRQLLQASELARLDILKSTSWRITTPIRWLSQWIRSPK